MIPANQLALERDVELAFAGGGMRAAAFALGY
jgi:hypothetical protein